MSVNVNLGLVLTVQETLEAGIDAIAAGNRIVTHNQFNTVVQMNSGTNPPATKVASDTLALVAGAKTLDLTALTGTNGAAVDGTGLKVQAFKIKNRTGNSALTVKFGASNPYNLLGASWTTILLAGQELMVYGNDATPDVSSTAKNIDVSGTGTESFDFSVVMG